MKKTHKPNIIWVLCSIVAIAVVLMLTIDFGSTSIQSFAHKNALQSKTSSDANLTPSATSTPCPAPTPSPCPTGTCNPDPKVNLLCNGDFETAAYLLADPQSTTTFQLKDMPNEACDGKDCLVGWDYDYCVDYIAGTPDCYNSNRCIDLGGMDGDGCGYCASITQAVTTVRGETYCLSFYMAGNYYPGPEVKLMKVQVGTGSATFEFDTCCTDATDTEQDNPATLATPTLTADKWICRKIQFKATGPITRIKFIDAGGGPSKNPNCTTGDEEGENLSNECEDRAGSGCRGFGPMLDNVVLVIGKCPTDGKCSVTTF